METLRKVEFSLGTYEFLPDEELQKENDELSRKRNGYFHRWVEDVDTSKDIPYIKPMALVEEIDTGMMHLVDYWNIQFIQNVKL